MRGARFPYLNLAGERATQANQSQHKFNTTTFPSTKQIAFPPNSDASTDMGRLTAQLEIESSTSALVLGKYQKSMDTKG
jgi:hypothetical protein